MDNIPFKKGALVTGKNRSYKRSIYKFIKPTADPDIGIFEFISLNGQTRKDHQRMAKQPVSAYKMPRDYAEFRLATWFEVKSSTTKTHHKLMSVLRRLIDGESYFDDNF
jgi:hypothetical protein